MQELMKLPSKLTLCGSGLRRNITLTKLLAVFAVMLSIGCAPVTGRARLYYNLDTAVNAIGILQDAAIGANSEGLISTDRTRIIVTFCNSSLKTIKASPTGWKNTVLAALDELNKNLTPEEHARFKSSLTLIEVALRSL
jgi:hypothetical protein